MGVFFNHQSHAFVRQLLKRNEGTKDGASSVYERNYMK